MPLSRAGAIPISPAFLLVRVDLERPHFSRILEQHTLGTIPDADVREAFRETAAIGGKEVTDDAPEACVRAIGGFPYMLQLVGFRC